MGTDNRIQTIEESTVYGLYHHGELIYVGCTTLALKRRLCFHRSDASKGNDAPIYGYIRKHVDAPKEDLEIRALDYDTEAAALQDLGHKTLNAQAADGAEYEGYDWTSEEIDVLEEESLNEASKRLDASFNQCRRAAMKLGLIDGDGAYTRVDWSVWDEALGTMSDPKLAEKIGCSVANVNERRRAKGIEAYQSRLSDDKVRAIWTRYHALEEATYASVAECFNVSKGTVARIIRKETYQDVERPPRITIEVAKRYHAQKDKSTDKGRILA
ncbi:hypothetical protein GGP85_002892 [Salinibacter ruber]|uniref:hypothetical protein n=1 Tax=Salinibacter ruber TaxID=146919 RepID=UPI002169863D|nr:hypothetical protein [Salinibacter ruber]MCS3827422.1 hypothetical protein [Salinibacter ruber]